MGIVNERKCIRKDTQIIYIYFSFQLVQRFHSVVVIISALHIFFISLLIYSTQWGLKEFFKKQQPPPTRNRERFPK